MFLHFSPHMSDMSSPKFNQVQPRVSVTLYLYTNHLWAIDPRPAAYVLWKSRLICSIGCWSFQKKMQCKICKCNVYTMETSTITTWRKKSSEVPFCLAPATHSIVLYRNWVRIVYLNHLSPLVLVMLSPHVC